MKTSDITISAPFIRVYLCPQSEMAPETSVIFNQSTRLIAFVKASDLTKGNVGFEVLTPVVITNGLHGVMSQKTLRFTKGKFIPLAGGELRASGICPRQLAGEDR
jgi:hypothetical protein